MYLPSLPEMTEFSNAPCRWYGSVLPHRHGRSKELGQIFLGPLERQIRTQAGAYDFACGILRGGSSKHLLPYHTLLPSYAASSKASARRRDTFFTRTIPADIYGGRTLAKVMAVIGAINGFAPACAPVLGGFVSEHFQWKGVFVF